jgi:hypothetical protein
VNPTALSFPSSESATRAGCEPAHFYSLPPNSPWRLAQSSPVQTDSHERGAAKAAGGPSEMKSPGLGALTGRGLQIEKLPWGTPTSSPEQEHKLHCFTSDSIFAQVQSDVKGL